MINGGIDSLPSVQEQLTHVDGVMLGRAAYHNPWLLAQCQRALYSGGLEAPEQAIEPLTAYLERQVVQGVPVKHVTRHVLGLFQGRPGARAWRRYLSEHAHLDDADTTILTRALDAMRAVQAA